MTAAKAKERSTPKASEKRGTATRRVYLVDGARTPFLKARGRPGPFSPVDLAVQCGRPLLMRQNIPADAYDQVILGCVNVVPTEMNPARVAALRLGMGEAMPAFTVQINCGSGMQSLDTAYKYIREGSSDLILAGGTEALSHAPMVLSRDAVDWLADFNSASSPQDYARQVTDFSPGDFKPRISLEQGLTDPVVGLSMGQTAEVLAQQFNISRKAADEYAVSSHKRLARAVDEGWLEDEVIAAVAPDGTLYKYDDGVRPDSSVDKLAGLKPVFEPPHGKVTAGNSSQVTDGASWMILASEEAVKKYGLTPKAVIVDSEWSALDPKIMGLGPVLSASAILKRQRSGLNDIDLWEINEAFAAQVLACLEAWDDPEFSRAAFGTDKPLGRLDPERLNVDGGAVAIGHPVGTSGNRIVLHLMNALHRKGLKKGIATECIGGGQSGAMMIEAL
ncbi:acetyl-CoA C-acetyltransferase [Marinobacter lacisalsi]|uniref:Acetyl-CoA C-acetyltransferase n=1 Tax=Marinobacter lacisalsi TaxID=475979 RepID=A0ABV8QGR3_9GAMM